MIRVKPLDPYGKAAIKAALKVLAGIVGYWVVLEAVIRCEAKGIMSFDEARTFMFLFGVTMFFLVLVSTTVDKSRGFLGKAWLRALLVIGDYFLICGLVQVCQANRMISPNHTLGFQITFPFLMYFFTLVVIFWPRRIPAQ